MAEMAVWLGVVVEQRSGHFRRLVYKKVVPRTVFAHQIRRSPRTAARGTRLVHKKVVLKTVFAHQSLRRPGGQIGYDV